MIQMSVQAIDSYSTENILDLWNQVQPELEYRKSLRRRVTRKDSRLQWMGQPEDGKTIVPFEYEIKSIAQGYLGGKEPIYTVRTDDENDQERQNAKEYKEKLDDICRYNDCQATHLSLVGSFLETTAAYLYIYQNRDGQIVHAEFDPLQTCGIWDFSTPSNLIGVVRGWKEPGQNNKEIQVVELITDKFKTTYEEIGNGVKIRSQETLNWNDVPVVAFEKPGVMAIFEPAITLIDAYEQIWNNIRSMTQYNDDAKMKMTGYHPMSELGTPERDEEEKNILKSRVMYVGDGGNVDWLIKEVDYNGLLEVLKSLQTLILFCVASPDTTDATFSSSESSLALRLKMFPFEMKAADTRAIFRKGYLRQVEIETNRLNLQGSNYDFTKVDVEIPVNVPSETPNSIDTAIAMKSSGLFSDQTCIQKSGLDVDPDQEMKRRQAEDEEGYLRLLDQTIQTKETITEEALGERYE